MVCVTQQKTCERLINSGEKLKESIGSNLYVIHVVKDEDNFLYNDKEPDALQYLFNISKQAGADLTVLRADDVIDTLKEFAKTKGIGHVVLGAPPKNSNGNFVGDLMERIQSARFHVVPAN